MADAKSHRVKRRRQLGRGKRSYEPVQARADWARGRVTFGELPDASGLVRKAGGRAAAIARRRRVPAEVSHGRRPAPSYAAGSWGRQRPRVADYAIVTGSTDGCDRRRRAFKILDGRWYTG
jgi:hypothetical protein